jgi:hypothetical protein
VSGSAGQLFSTLNATAIADCELALSRACEASLLIETSDDFTYADTSSSSGFSGLEVAGAVAAGEA